MGIHQNQMPEKFIDICKSEIDIFRKPVSITQENKIPDTYKIPIENPSHWIKIPKVISVFVDMVNSTKLNTELNNPKKFTPIMRLFTNTAVKIFHEINSPYIDIKGDGVFALFDGNQPHTALCGAVLFKTFIEEEFSPKINCNIETGVKIGIDSGTVFVRRVGLKFHNDRTDRQNEIWAGTPVNTSSKVLSLCDDKNQIIVSERYYKLLTDKKAIKSCGCKDGSFDGNIVDLWTLCENKNRKFDFESYYILKSRWCPTHGKEYCSHLLEVDK